MNDIAAPGAYGVLTEPTTLTIQRHLPGPIERIWAYLTDSELRRQWLAAGAMEMQVGSPFTLTWRNDELTDPPGQRPDGFAAEHSLDGHITECDPPRRLGITWGSTGGVTFDLAPAGNRVLLTITHHRVADPSMLLKVSAGWHAHLDILVARVTGEQPGPFWDGWLRLHDDYARRMPG